MAQRDQLLALYEPADRKGYDVTQSTMRDHVRLIDKDGNLVRNEISEAAHSSAEAQRYLEALPNRKSQAAGNDIGLWPLRQRRRRRTILIATFRCHLWQRTNLRQRRLLIGLLHDSPLTVAVTTGKLKD